MSGPYREGEQPATVPVVRDWRPAWTLATAAGWSAALLALAWAGDRFPERHALGFVLCAIGIGWTVLALLNIGWLWGWGKATRQ